MRLLQSFLEIRRNIRQHLSQKKDGRKLRKQKIVSEYLGRIKKCPLELWRRGADTEVIPSITSAMVVRTFYYCL